MSDANIERVTAGMVVIGDEILSGRTKDKNIGFVADYVTALGIDLVEVRIVADDTGAIVEAVNAVRTRVTYLFTSGGIGPTHDDITADAIAIAFGVPISHDPRAVQILTDYYAGRGMELNEARLRMARLPEGSDIIANKVSGAPGFRIGNVHVMAGVPSVMQGMMDAIAPTLTRGRPMISVSIDAGMGEGRIAGPLAALAKAHAGVIIGSYPYQRDNTYATMIVARCRDEAPLEVAAAAIRLMIAELKKDHP